MQVRELGRSGVSVPPLVFGANVFGWTADRATTFRLLDALVDNGLTAIDTADAYSSWVSGHEGGESETLIGEWLAARGTAVRDRLVIATKVGLKMPGGQGLGAAWIARAVDDSLRRLRTDRIDLYQAHRDDPGTPLEETMTAFGRLVAEGKVRALGASNYDAARLAEALAVSHRLSLPRFECLQPHYNLIERPGYEAELAPLCAREGLGVIPYFALAAGFLTGKYRNEADLAKSPRGKGLKKYLDARGLRILAALDEAAAQHGATPGQIALAWLAAQPTVTAPIVSATTLDQLGDLVTAMRITLSPVTLAALAAAST